MIRNRMDATYHDHAEACELALVRLQKALADSDGGACAWLVAAAYEDAQTQVVELAEALLDLYLAELARVERCWCWRQSLER